MKNKQKTGKTHQRGAVLVTFIVAMVIMALAGSSMLYFSTTSSYGELLANRQERAYYVGESGVNYALQKYLANNANLYPESAPLTGTLSNGDQFKVSSIIESKGTPAADWLVIKSTGTVGSGWLTSRQLVTKEIKKALATPPGVPPVTTDASGTPLGFDTNANTVLDTTWTPTPGTDTGIVSTGPSGGPALQFKGDVGAIDLSTNAVDLVSAWESNGNLLSYFLQVKININSQGDKGYHYLIGLTFRKGSNDSNDNFYGLSFYRSNGLSKLPVWCTTAFTDVIPRNDGQVYAVLWKNSGANKTVLAYALMTYATYGVVTDATNQTLAAWPTLFIRVNERFDGPSGARRNHLKAYVMTPTSSTTLNWNLSSFKQITWTTVPTALNPNQSGTVQEILEDTFTSAGFTASRPEIGVHAYYDSNASNDQFFNGFGTAIQGTTGGSSQY